MDNLNPSPEIDHQANMVSMINALESNAASLKASNDELRLALKSTRLDLARANSLVDHLSRKLGDEYTDRIKSDHAHSEDIAALNIEKDVITRNAKTEINGHLHSVNQLRSELDSTKSQLASMKHSGHNATTMAECIADESLFDFASSMLIEVLEESALNLSGRNKKISAGLMDISEVYQSVDQSLVSTDTACLMLESLCLTSIEDMDSNTVEQARSMVLSHVGSYFDPASPAYANIDKLIRTVNTNLNTGQKQEYAGVRFSRLSIEVLADILTALVNSRFENAFQYFTEN